MIDFYKKAFTKNEELDPALYKEFLEKQLILREYPHEPSFYPQCSQS